MGAVDVADAAGGNGAACCGRGDSGVVVVFVIAGELGVEFLRDDGDGDERGDNCTIGNCTENNKVKTNLNRLLLRIR